MLSRLPWMVKADDGSALDFVFRQLAARLERISKPRRLTATARPRVGGVQRITILGRDLRSLPTRLAEKLAEVEARRVDHLHDLGLQGVLFGFRLRLDEAVDHLGEFDQVLDRGRFENTSHGRLVRLRERLRDGLCRIGRHEILSFG